MDGEPSYTPVVEYMTHSDRFSASRCNLPWAPAEGISADQTIVASHSGFPDGDTDSQISRRVTASPFCPSVRASDKPLANYRQSAYPCPRKSGQWLALISLFRCAARRQDGGGTRSNFGSTCPKVYCQLTLHRIYSEKYYLFAK